MWLNPDYGRFLGVDFEALRVRTVLTDFAGGIVAQKEVALRAGLSRDAVLKIVLDAAKTMARQAGLPPAVRRRHRRAGTSRYGPRPDRPLRAPARLPGCAAAR